MKNFLVLSLLLVLLVVPAFAQNITVQITIPQAFALDVVDAFALRYGYQAQIPDPTWVPPDPLPEDPPDHPLIPNPESKVQFAKRMVRQFIVETYRTEQVKKAANEAASTAGQDKRVEVEANGELITVQ